jgi:hypothetical protein
LPGFIFNTKTQSPGGVPDHPPPSPSRGGGSLNKLDVLVHEGTWKLIAVGCAYAQNGGMFLDIVAWKIGAIIAGGMVQHDGDLLLVKWMTGN